MTKAEHSLPAQQNNGAARKAEGFATPEQDKKVQCARFLPQKVLPIIFLPGIMGSNLKMSTERQRQMRQDTNIAWRPEALGLKNVSGASRVSPQNRQLGLDPLQTSVDIYNPSGLPEVSGDERNANAKLQKDFHTPLLMDDLPTAKNRRTATQKARTRGWGEVLFDSYGQLLQHMESRLNNTFVNGVVQKEWYDVVGVNPNQWGADPSLPQQPLTEDELKKVATGCWFPVYAFGCNWLQSNGESAKIIAARVNSIIATFNESRYECNQVIVVTHSMGGLVGRALIHPDYGNLQEKVLGIVHGVMPSIGAPAAYKRMRAGFEDPGIKMALVRLSPAESISAKVIGNYGQEVTAVLANAEGGLQLLPSESYGNGWLHVTCNDLDLETWPKNGDPYSEIYKLKGKWYSLFREKWINPSGWLPQNGGGSFNRTCNYLDKAKNFHKTLANTFHPNSYAHYGVDPLRQSFGEVIWEIRNCVDSTGWQNWPIISDNGQGNIELVRWDPFKNNKAILPFKEDEPPNSVYAEILPPSAPGDQTVPAKSADHQLSSGKFKGVFRQTGYEHQTSYTDPRAVASTLYSVVRIAQQATWKC